MKIGLAIKKTRKLKGIKQYELAEMSGITQSYLSGIESERKSPSLDTLEMISNALCVPLPIILWFSSQPSDVVHTKQEIFKTIKPIVDGLLEELI